MKTNTTTKQSQDALLAVRDALLAVRTREQALHRPCFLVVCFDGSLLVTEDMPLLGEWYTADGVRHG